MTNTLKLIQYNTWANNRLLEVALRLSEEQYTKEVGGSFPSIRLTVLHLLTSDWIWMHRFKGIPLAAIPGEWAIAGAQAISAIWMPVQKEMEAVVNDESANPGKPVTFTTKKGDTYTMPLMDLVVHVTNHGTYHRGQLVNMMRMLGEQPANTDYFIFCALHNEF